MASTKSANGTGAVITINYPGKVLDTQNEVLLNLEASQRDKLKELESRMSDILVLNGNNYFLLKWLKARKFDINAAEAMLRQNLKWRSHLRVDNLSQEFKIPQVLNDFFPVRIIGHDRFGGPLWIFLFGRMDTRGLLNSSTRQEVIKCLIYYLENIKEDMIIQTEQKRQLIEKHTVLFDIEGFEMKQALWKPVFDMYVTLLQMYEANYPESLRAAFMVNAPKIFLIFFGLIKQFMSEDTRTKVYIHGKDNWREHLLEFVDENQLPKHWGGTLVDEVDGNPYYSSKVCMGGKVPETFYHPEMLVDQSDLKTKVISKMEKFKLDFTVSEPGSSITWTFKTDNHDINFGVSFRPFNKNGDEENEKLVYLRPVERVYCQLVPEEGYIVCDDIGKYTLIFDNSFSWMTSKKMLYYVEMLGPMRNDNEKGQEIN